MARPIDLGKLIASLSSHRCPWVNDQGESMPETQALAAKVVRYCVQNQIPWPVANLDGKPEGAPISVTTLGSAAYQLWALDSHAEDYWETHMPSEEDEMPKSVWDMPGTFAFEKLAVHTMAQHFIISFKDEGLFQLYEIEDFDQRVVVPVIGSQDDIATTLSRKLRQHLASQGVATTRDKVGTARCAFMAAATAYPPPVLHAQPGEDTWCLHRATIMPDETVPFPHIQQFLDRLNDPEAFAAWWYGIYSGRNKGRQMMYLHDARGEGAKSVILKTLAAALFGDRIYASFPGGPSNHQDSHTSSAFIGKRLVVIGDCNNAYVLHSAILKQLSGDDKSYHNPKFVQPFSTYLQCRVVVASNYAPFIISAAHNRSRTLYLTVEPLDIPDSARDVEYGAKCERELPGFLAYGKRCYEERCPNDYAIAVNQAVQDATNARIAICETQHAEFFDEWFVADPAGVLTSKQWNQVVKSTKLDTHRAEDTLNWIKVMCDTQEVMGQRKGSWELPRVRLRGDNEDNATFAESR